MNAPERFMPTDDYIRRGTWPFRRVAISMVAAGFSTFALMNCVQPLMPVFSSEFGISAADASLSLSVNIAVLALVMPLTSALSEMIGRKSIMAISLIISSVLTIISAFSTEWSTFLTYRALQGATFSGVPAVAMAYMAEEIDRRQVGFAIGLYVSGAAIGGMAGRVIAGVILDWGNWHHAMLAIGIVSLFSALAFIALLPPSRHFAKHDVSARRIVSNYGSHLRDPIQLRLYAVGFLLMGTLVAVYNNLSYRLLAPPFTLSQSVVGLLFSVYLAGIASSTLAGAAADRFGRGVVLLSSMATALVGVLVMLVSPLPAVLVGLVIFTVGFFASHSVASGWVSRQATEAKAQASSLYLFAYYFGGAILGWFAGVCWERAGWGGVTALVATCFVLSFALVWRFRRPVLHVQPHE